MTEVTAAGQFYEKAIEAARASEEDRSKALDGRGATIIATSTTMLTLIFGLTVVVTGKSYEFKNHHAILLVSLAMVAYVLASVIALFVQTWGLRTGWSARRRSRRC